MQIKKRYIKEEIERLDQMREAFYKLARVGQEHYNSEISRLSGRINALEWVLGFADD